MNILVINCGSSSLKYQLIDTNDENVLAKGLVERIGINGSILTQKVKGLENFVIKQPMKDHNDAISHVIDALLNKEYGVIKSVSEIAAIGHRIVHGGEKYTESVLFNEDVKKELKECEKLAPLHNPAHMMGIEACVALMPNTPMALVFDTAFHQTMPKEAFRYSLPEEFYTKHGIRKYGFHGTSHKYVSSVLAETVGKNIEDLKIVTCHLGNGSSCAAIKGGKSIDTSMGFTPLDGLVMGTRTGSIDPAVVTYLIKELGYSVEAVDRILNKESGVLALSGISSDFRDIRKAAGEGNENAKLALDMFDYKVKQYIGAYAASMGGIDYIIFTAGVGENVSVVRDNICKGLEFLGVKLDDEKNKNTMGELADISAKDSSVKVYVVPTNEELMIARETLNLIRK